MHVYDDQEQILIFSWFHQQLSEFSITININIDSVIGMKIENDQNTKPHRYYQATSSRSCLNFKFNNLCLSIHPNIMSPSDFVDPEPIHLSKQDQTLYMQIIGFFCYTHGLVPISHFC